MNQSHLFTLLSFLFISCTTPALKVKPKTDKALYHLKGNVATVVIKKHSIFSEKDEKNVLTFNEEGNIIEKEEYYGDSIYQQISYSYNKNLLVSKAKTSRSGTTFSVTYEYDENGFKTKTINGQVDLLHKNTMENGKIKRIETYNTVMDLLAEQEDYTYFADHYEKVVKEYDDGSRFTTDRYKYDLQDNLLEHITDDKCGHKFQYNSQSEFIKETVNCPDDNEDTIQTDKFYSDYDAQGNWTKMIEKEKDKVTRTVTRMILYKK